MAVQITVLGLNQIGISLGLALQNHEKGLVRIGSDQDIVLEQKAMKLKAFERCVHNLAEAVEQADIVVLTTPLDEIHTLLEAIATTLKPGAVVLTTAPLHVQVLAWAQAILPAERHLLTFTPNPRPSLIEFQQINNQPDADLFKNGSIVIGSTAETNPNAVRLAADLARMLDAKPIYFDPYEADGVLAFARLLPYLSAAAVTRSAANQAGWKESRKLAGQELILATQALDLPSEKTILGQYALLNGQNSLRAVDALIQELTQLREMIANQDDHALRAYLEQAANQRSAWLEARASGRWEKIDPPPLPTSGEQLSKLFWFRGKPKDRDKQS